MDTLSLILDWLNTISAKELFSIGNTNITLKTILIFSISLFLLFYLSSRLSRFLTNKIFPRYNINKGIGDSIGKIIRYLIIVIGLYVIFQSTGIDLSAIGLLLGALGVGIGFGLQNITGNFISGIIILFERPIKVGDRVEVDNLAGNVVEISARATTILTNDNIAVIVPNSDFINLRVINWSHNNDLVRLNLALGVSYREDPGRVQELLLSLIKQQSGVLASPDPYVRFDGFGESSIDFTLQFWTSEFINRPMILKSEVYYAIFRKFREVGIEIPFPQRDLHLRSGFESIDSLQK